MNTMRNGMIAAVGFALFLSQNPKIGYAFQVRSAGFSTKCRKTGRQDAEAG